MFTVAERDAVRDRVLELAELLLAEAGDEAAHVEARLRELLA